MTLRSRPQQSRPRKCTAPKMGILGAGSMGLLWASQLVHSHPVTLINNKPVPNRQLAFSVQHQDQVTQTRIRSLTATEVEAPVECLLVCTKSYDTARAVQGVLNRLCPTGNILLLQNGLGSQDEVVQLLADSGLDDVHVYALSTTEGANRASDTELIYAGKGSSWLGPYNQPARQHNRADSLARDISRSGLTVIHESEIQRRLWKKLMVNCGINPFTVLLNCPNGHILNTPLFAEHIDSLALELEQISSHAGNAMSARQIKADIIEVATRTRENISSTLQDVRAGKKTEMDYMNGYINRYAMTNGIPAPVNRMLYQEVNKVSQTRTP
ncbi:MAG: hypothetical protein CSA52_02150 [Gammaproteobacteria bacterium]|nr:MAG: hypothetical protein CSB48_06135 [Pseudomonadota bacterium]PIE38395.1 MAG: hypothetical protein CSA52_02150 [Gammaproteobacteria bacterium]